MSSLRSRLVSGYWRAVSEPPARWDDLRVFTTAAWAALAFAAGVAVGVALAVAAAA